MTSVQPSPHSIGKSAPSFRKAVNLLGFGRVIGCDLLKQGDFIGHDLKVSNWPPPCPRHICVSVQGLAGLDDALIGFFWGHS